MELITWFFRENANLLGKKMQIWLGKITKLVGKNRNAVKKIRRKDMNLARKIMNLYRTNTKLVEKSLNLVGKKYDISWHKMNSVMINSRNLIYVSYMEVIIWFFQGKFELAWTKIQIWSGKSTNLIGKNRNVLKQITKRKYEFD